MSENAIKDRQTLQDGHVLFRKDQPATKCYLIVSGEVVLYEKGEAGGETILSTCTAGEFVGVSAVLNGRDYTSNARVQGGAVVIPVADTNINTEFKKMNKLGQNFFSCVIDRLNTHIK